MHIKVLQHHCPPSFASMIPFSFGDFEYKIPNCFMIKQWEGCIYWPSVNASEGDQDSVIKIIVFRFKLSTCTEHPG